MPKNQRQALWGAAVKLAALIAVPPRVVTEIGPVVAFTGTIAAI